MGSSAHNLRNIRGNALKNMHSKMEKAALV